MIEKCVETTKNTPEDEFNSLPDKDLLAKEVKDLDLYDDTHIENDQKIDYLKKLESGLFCLPICKPSAVRILLLQQLCSISLRLA